MNVMKKIVSLLAVAFCLLSCQQESAVNPYVEAQKLELASKNKQVARSFEAFVSSPGYADSRDMWRGKAINQYNPKNSRVEILLREQRGRLYINDQIAMDFPVCSGRVGGYETPKGHFRITEKKRDHRSSLYGSFVGPGNEVVREDVKSADKAPTGARFKGASMPYWMRFNGAIGMHVGSVYRSGASHGCVRVPVEACSILFEKLAVGSVVIVK